MEMFFFLKRIIKFQPCLRLKVKYRCTSEKFKVDTGFILGFIGFYWVLLGFTDAELTLTNNVMGFEIIVER